MLPASATRGSEKRAPPSTTNFSGYETATTTSITLLGTPASAISINRFASSANGLPRSATQIWRVSAETFPEASITSSRAIGMEAASRAEIASGP
jgi:hypothetical protein